MTHTCPSVRSTSLKHCLLMSSWPWCTALSTWLHFQAAPWTTNECAGVCVWGGVWVGGCGWVGVGGWVWGCVGVCGGVGVWGWVWGWGWGWVWVWVWGWGQCPFQMPLLLSSWPWCTAPEYLVNLALDDSRVHMPVCCVCVCLKGGGAWRDSASHT
jgi:hypothetical protein